MIDLSVKSMFFDRKAVTDATDRATRQALSRAGAFIRTSAKHSIRPRKGTSQPGKPPFSHEGSLRRLIYFGFDAANVSVVVGPVRFKKGTAPHLLEFGGRGTVSRRGKSVRATFRARPFMGPALVREAPKLPRFWAGSVKG